MEHTDLIFHCDASFPKGRIIMIIEERDRANQVQY